MRMERLEVELNLAQKEKDRFGVGQLGGLLNFEIFNCGELFFRFRQAASFPTNPPPSGFGHQEYLISPHT